MRIVIIFVVTLLVAFFVSKFLGLIALTYFTYKLSGFVMEHLTASRYARRLSLR